MLFLPFSCDLFRSAVLFPLFAFSAFNYNHNYRLEYQPDKTVFVYASGFLNGLMPFIQATVDSENLIITVDSWIPHDETPIDHRLGLGHILFEICSDKTGDEHDIEMIYFKNVLNYHTLQAFWTAREALSKVHDFGVKNPNIYQNDFDDIYKLEAHLKAWNALIGSPHGVAISDFAGLLRKRITDFDIVGQGFNPNVDLFISLK